MEIAIDAGKRRSYFVAEAEGKTIDEGYVPTTKEGFERMLAEKEGIKAVIVESSSTTQRIAALLEGLNVVMAHPTKIRMIADSFIKTDKVDAHTIIAKALYTFIPLKINLCTINLCTV